MISAGECEIPRAEGRGGVSFPETEETGTGVQPVPAEGEASSGEFVSGPTAEQDLRRVLCGSTEDDGHQIVFLNNWQPPRRYVFEDIPIPRQAPTHSSRISPEEHRLLARLPRLECDFGKIQGKK